MDSPQYQYAIKIRLKVSYQSKVSNLKHNFKNIIASESQINLARNKYVYDHTWNYGQIFTQCYQCIANKTQT